MRSRKYPVQELFRLPERDVTVNLRMVVIANTRSSYENSVRPE